jgi:hypothetical protein
MLLGMLRLFLNVILWRSKKRQITEEDKRSPQVAIRRSWIFDSVMSGWRRIRPKIIAMRLDAAGAAIPADRSRRNLSLAAKRCNQRTALAMLTPKRLAAGGWISRSKYRQIPSLRTSSWSLM